MSDILFVGDKVCSVDILEGSEEVNAIPTDIDEDDKYLLLVSGNSKYLPPLTSHLLSSLLLLFFFYFYFYFYFTDVSTLPFSFLLFSSPVVSFLRFPLISTHLFFSYGLHYVFVHYVFFSSSYLITRYSTSLT